MKLIPVFTKYFTPGYSFPRFILHIDVRALRQKYQIFCVYF